MSSTTSPNQEGVEGLDSAVVWMFTEPSAILVISTSLLRIVVFFLFKEAYFYAGWLPVTSRCAIRGSGGDRHRGAVFPQRSGGLCPRRLDPYNPTTDRSFHARVYPARGVAPAKMVRPV